MFLTVAWRLSPKVVPIVPRYSNPLNTSIDNVRAPALPLPNVMPICTVTVAFDPAGIFRLIH